MTTFSKYFSERAKNLTCKDVYHPDFESCSSYFWFFLRKSMVQTLKYMAPIFYIPLLVNFRSTSFNEWKEKTETYLKMSIGSSGTLALSFYIHCFLCKICNEVRYFNMSFIPMLIGLITSVNYLPPKFANMQFLFMTNLFVQTLMRTSEYRPVKIIRESRIVTTALFMILSSLIMGLMDLITDEKHRYWYAQTFQPKKYEKNGMLNKVDGLKDLIHKQVMSTVKVGLFMSSIKIITKSVQLLRTSSIFEFVVFFVRNFDYKLLGFFVIYGTSFQVFNFLLNEFNMQRKQHQKSFLAGFVSGAAFYLSPRYFLFTYAFTALIELLTKLSLSKLDQNSKKTKFLRSVPWLKIFTCISIPTFTHWRIFQPWLVPQVMDKLMQVLGLDRLALGSQNYAKYILGI